MSRSDELKEDLVVIDFLIEETRSNEVKWTLNRLAKLIKRTIKYLEERGY